VLSPFNEDIEAVEFEWKPQICHLATRDTEVRRSHTFDFVALTFELVGAVFQRVALRMVFTLDMALKVKEFTLEPCEGSELVQFDDLIRQFHEALGGEFRIGDRLCWKDDYHNLTAFVQDRCKDRVAIRFV
jgi:hypothetical protein